MALTPTNNYGSFNGTTSVDLVAAPASSTRRVVKFITLYNNDTASRDLTIRLTASGPTQYIVTKQTLASGASYQWTGSLILDATTESVTGVADATAATTEPTFTTHWITES
jgi:hypothetical protein